ncbi:MAG: zinc-binding dehydrogenase [Chloroflexota bacterium]
MGNAAVLTAEGKVEVRQYPVLDAPDDGLLMAVGLSGICGTDLHMLRPPGKALLDRAPVIIGHEACGRVVSIGKRAHETMNLNEPLKAGDRIVYAPVRSCGHCWWDRHFGDNHGSVCDNPNMATRNSEAPPHFIGAWADYYFVRPGTWVWKIPDGMPYEVAVLTEPFSIAIRGVERAMSLPAWKNEQTLAFGGTVAVLGAGAIGLLTAAAARIAGAGRIVLVGAPASALETAREMGIADDVIDLEEYDAQQRIERVRSLSPGGYGPDVVFEAAGVPSAFVEGLEMVRRLGTFVEMGCFIDTGKTVEINVAKHITRKDLTLFASFAAQPHYFEKALLTLQATASRFDWARLVTARFPVSQIANAIQAASDVHTRGVKVVLQGADASAAEESGK